MATDGSTLPTDEQDLVTLTFLYHGKPQTLSLPSDSTITDLSDEIAALLSIPASNQKLMVSKLGLLKTPFKDPELPIVSIADKKITLLGSTATEASSVAEAAEQVARRKMRRGKHVQAYKTHDWKKEQEDAQYTFLTLRPLPYLPKPINSLIFLQRLRDDAGIKAAMRKHKFTVPLLTEMNPAEHTQSDHQGTSRILGLNRNKGEVIELRLRTDAGDGYRDYKTIRKTLCHELAHNVHGDHDRHFWDLCKMIEREVEAVTEGGRTIAGGGEEYYGGHEEEEHHDEGGWVGGEYVLGGGSGVNAETESYQGISRREILARAAERRMRKASDGPESGHSDKAGSGSG